MSAIRIVTDSSTHFHNQDFPLQHQIVVVPHSICIGGRSYSEGVNITSEEFLTQLDNHDNPPEIVAPSPDEFAAQFRNLSSSTYEIICLCVSSRLSCAWQHASQAAQPLLGKMDIAVVDSQTISTGLGVLVRAAAEAVVGDVSLSSLRGLIRNMIPRIYSAFFSDSLNYMHRFGRAGTSQAILGDMLGVKPIVTLEEGDFAPMEKVGTRTQASERLLEFAAEFTDIATVDVLYGRPERVTEARQLANRLTAKFPRAAISRAIFRPSLAALVGPDGLGVVVCEH